MAVANYADREGIYPPAVVRDADGKPLHSWRTVLLPYLEAQRLYQDVLLDEPWEHETNLTVGTQIGEFLRCPSAHGSDPTHTNYLAMVGPDAPWGRAYEEADRDAPTSILVVELQNTGVHWMQPQDITRESLLDLAESGKLSPHGTKVNVLYSDCSARSEDLSVVIEQLKRGRDVFSE